jgi:hypothetical protein
MIALEHYLAVAAMLFIEPQKYHYLIDVHRIDAVGGQYQSCRFLEFSG